MNNDHYELVLHIIFTGPLILAMIFYLLGVVKTSRRYLKKWSLYRTGFWMLGILSAAVALIGPLANLSHLDFRAHMVGHLLLGMVAPLLMVLAAPITLLLRTLPVIHARRITRILRSWSVAVLGYPVFTSFMTIGGMYFLYTTPLYNLMQHNILLHVLVHIHLFIAGYLFTASIIYIDPPSHRTSFVFRSCVLVFTLAAHGILSKYIFANPPIGVSAAQSETGGMIMYYGGDAVEITLVFILCFQWYKNTRPRDSSSPSSTSPILSNEAEKMI